MTAAPQDDARARVAIIIVNWNNWRDCVECLDSLLGLSYHDFHIFLVDNDSADGSVERIAEWCGTPSGNKIWRRHDGVQRLTDDPENCRVGIPFEIAERPEAPIVPSSTSIRVSIIKSGRNLGYAGGCNVGIRAAGLENFTYFWFLNGDTVVHRDALSALVSRANRSEGVGMVGSTLRFYDQPDRVQAMGGGQLDLKTMSAAHIGVGLRAEQVPSGMSDALEVERRLIYIFGASMLVTRSFIEKVGLMQEDYFLYYEEFDWAMRGRGSFSLGYAADSHIFHKSGASSSKIMPVFTARYYYRNRIRFFSRFFPAHMASVKRGLIYDFIRHTLRGRWNMARIVAEALRDAPRLTVRHP